MSQSGEAPVAEMEVTPEERRFLERFFRRQMLPWFVALVVISITSAWAFRSDDGGDREARLAASLAQMSTANERLRADLAALAERVEAGASRGSQSANELERSIEDARRNVRMIETRVTAALDRRLDALEARLETGAAVPAGSLELPDDAAAWDVSTILERLQALERRQERGLVAGAPSADRVAELEARIAALEDAGGPLPAAPAVP